MKYKYYYNLNGSTKSVVLTSSAAENTKGSKFSSFVSTNTGNCCTIEVGAGGNIQTYTLNVYRYEGIKLSKTELTIPVGSTPSLTVSKGMGVDDASVTWSSSDETVAAVTDGVIAAKGTGTAFITAKAGSYTAECKVTVKAADELLIGRNTFGYLKDIEIGQPNETDYVDFDFDPEKIWHELTVNSNDPQIFFTVTADEKYVGQYGNIVFNTEYSVDGGATWFLDSSSKYDKNILNDGTLSAKFQTIEVGDGYGMSFKAGETLLMRTVVGTYTPVTGVTGATVENSDVYYFKVTQRASLSNIIAADSEGQNLPLNQEFEASVTEYVIKNFSGDTVSLTPTAGQAAADCNIYVEGKLVSSAAAAVLTVEQLPVNKYGYPYATIVVKYEGSGTGRDETYTVTLAPGEYNPVISTQPAAETNCVQLDEVYLNMEAAAPEGKGAISYQWTYAPNQFMWNATTMEPSSEGKVRVNTDVSGTYYYKCTITNAY
ncbi:MAG: Ig-like domain-containing protein, partial [Firmicutes bacterium]|nr:Ig-like domain-containing protein [Bacillota bacterium]